MKDDLANQLLTAVMDWDEDTQSRYVEELMTLAALKWDSYDGFRAGQRFMESLARWLPQFKTDESRYRWLDFLVEHMTFISAAEVDHLVSVAYPDVIRPDILRRTANEQGIPAHLKRRVTDSVEFRLEQRRTLVMALSDGARLDVLRRKSDLSHEQFVTNSEVPSGRVSDLAAKLHSASTAFGCEPVSTFRHVLLVDDFYGSGTSLINVKAPRAGIGPSELKGKVNKFLAHASTLLDPKASPHGPLLEADYRVTILLYMASDQAYDHILQSLNEAGLSETWDLRVIQRFADLLKVTDPKLLQDCDDFWDPILEDEHKGNSSQGYKGSALPVVLNHNTPNNSVSPLWADSRGRKQEGKTGKNQHALFPRYERHHSDRP